MLKVQYLNTGHLVVTATMQDKLTPLAREVERLVTAPYVPSLQVSLLPFGALLI